MKIYTVIDHICYMCIVSIICIYIHNGVSACGCININWPPWVLRPDQINLLLLGFTGPIFALLEMPLAILHITSLLIESIDSIN